MRKIKKIRAQSILEYLITLSAIVGIIIVGTIGFSTGLGRGLDTAQGGIQGNFFRDHTGGIVNLEAETQGEEQGEE